MLFTSRRYDSLPGLPSPGDPDEYPRPRRGDRLSRKLRVGLRTDSPVEQPVQSRSTSKGFVLNLGERMLEAGQVVVATGPFKVPNVPAFAGTSRRTSPKCTALATGRSRDVPEGTVVPVDGGNTGLTGSTPSALLEGEAVASITSGAIANVVRRVRSGQGMMHAPPVHAREPSASLRLSASPSRMSPHPLPVAVTSITERREPNAQVAHGEAGRYQARPRGTCLASAREARRTPA